MIVAFACYCPWSDLWFEDDLVRITGPKNNTGEIRIRSINKIDRITTIDWEAVKLIEKKIFGLFTCYS